MARQLQRQLCAWRMLRKPLVDADLEEEGAVLVAHHDAAINSADSTAAPGHPMIDPIWRGRFAIGDVLLPLRRRDPLVAAVYAALTLNNFAYKAARGAVHFIRSRRGKPG